MSFASKHNSASLKFDYEIPKTHNFAKPIELVDAHGLDKVYTVRSMYINRKGKYGDEPVLVIDECILNAPSHLLPVVKDALANEDDVKSINAGKVGFKFYEYENDKGKQLGIEWVDLK